jgi:hypothetical protein
MINKHAGPPTASNLHVGILNEDLLPFGSSMRDVTTLSLSRLQVQIDIICISGEFSSGQDWTEKVQDVRITPSILEAPMSAFTISTHTRRMTCRLRPLLGS